MTTQIFKWVDNLKFYIIKEQVTASVTTPFEYHNFFHLSVNFQTPYSTIKFYVM